MTRVELAGLCVCFMFFACGGLVGSMHTMLRLLSIDHARLPWRAKLRVYHFFGEVVHTLHQIVCVKGGDD